MIDMEKARTDNFDRKFVMFETLFDKISLGQARFVKRKAFST